MGSSEAARKAWRTRRKSGKKKASKKGRRKATKKDQKWIAAAVKRPGALREKVQFYYREKGFDKKGRIKVSVLRELIKNPRGESVKDMARTKQQAQFALNVRPLK